MADSKGKLPFAWYSVAQLRQRERPKPRDSHLLLIEHVSVHNWEKHLRKPVWENLLRQLVSNSANKELAAGAVVPREIRDVHINRRGSGLKNK